MNKVLNAQRWVRLAGGALAALSMLAAVAGTATDGRARYEAERAACLNGNSNQDQSTCLKEAGAANDEARRGGLKDGDVEYRKNALIRCKALPEKDRPDCKARIEGDGKVSGSALEGGILRERVTRDVGVKPPADASSGASSATR